ncbi:hypothetical protein AXK57_21890 [Tsukamurella pulmonis]|uniref:hypothetical protein n=1 Tax=Tsukamurella pulmonis TaxID=47312 RepID=UPI000793C0FF|nr:hypothetical protein [Tsukamurella pulmonis]KXP11595.1 hypothetical protein AXK57_21890 [Tsukamurella pulmonis]
MGILSKRRDRRSELEEIDMELDAEVDGADEATDSGRHRVLDDAAMRERELLERWKERRLPPKRNRRLDKYGWYQHRSEPGLTTTRQAEALNLAISRRSDRHRGLITGVDRLTRSPVIADPFELYGADVTNINVSSNGDIGSGKSSMTSTALARHVSVGRKVFCLDKKRQGGRGEYTKLAQALGAPSVQFASNSGTRLNLLDPGIAAERRDVEADLAPASQQTLIVAVLEDAMRETMSEQEIAAVNRALVAVTKEAKGKGKAATVDLLAHRLLNPLHADLDEYGERFAERSGDWGLRPGLALRRLIDGDLRGLLDGETTDDITEALDHPFVHLDISGLPENGPAIRVVMTVLNTLISNIAVQRSRQKEQTVQAIEEGWHVAEGSTGRLVMGNLKLSRGLGLSTYTAFHRPSDLPEGSAAQSLMRENGIIFCYRQGRRRDAEEVCSLYNFPPGTEDILMSLPRGVCLAKIGSNAPLVMEHVRSPLEEYWTDTDDVIMGSRVAGRVAI